VLGEVVTRILVVEDEPGIALGLEDTLSLEGYQVEVVGDGLEAARRVVQETFDLIVLDVMLPGKSGLEICRELRRRDPRTPVILLTAKTRERDCITGLEAGANDYVSKPFSARELAARVRGLLRYATTAHEDDALDIEARGAWTVQQRMVPIPAPPAAGLDYSCLSRPAGRVSGDYYDYLPLSRGRLAFLVADVCGKGMPAALLGASLVSLVRAGLTAGDHAGQVLARANELMFARMGERYVTAFLGIYDPSARMLTYANAGHYPPIVVHAEDVDRLSTLTPPIGLFAELEPAEQLVELRREDWLIVPTDGIIEAADETGEEFGAARLIGVVRARADAPAAAVCERLVDAAAAFSNHRRADDMTVLAAHVLTES
jgi:sigma-B regulation protein RsbU (phosphoserine phosphatase)